MIWGDQNVIVKVNDQGLCHRVGLLPRRRRERAPQRAAAHGRAAHQRLHRGCHLTGAIFEPVIEPSVKAFQDANVGRVLPAHCTGWKAVHLLAHAMPAAFVQPTVATVGSP
jgi:7,8-dihydropterin-6-yl-methyl-4-(beta-D-ribofuranosyl)aminobenzene 5'-phosphate synthase